MKIQVRVTGARRSPLAFGKLIYFFLDLKFLVVEALETTLPLLTSISVQLHARLDMIQKHFNLFRTNNTKDADQLLQNPHSMPDALQFEANIVDGPNVHARASLYIYMNAAVSACSRNPDHHTNLLDSFVDDQ